MEQIAELEIHRLEIATLEPHPDNPRRGDIPAIAESLEMHGQYKPIVVQRSRMRVCAGNHTMAAAETIGWDRIQAVVIDVDDDQARRILLADNQTSDRATNDVETLVKMLLEMQQTEAGFAGTAFTTDDLDSLVQQMTADSLGKTEIPTERRVVTHPVTAVFSVGDIAMTLLGARFGWRGGCASTGLSGFRSLKMARPRLIQSGIVAFVDNDFKEYNHREHMEAVEEFRPAFATTRDIMTTQQCEEAGIDFFSLDQILAFAEDIAAHCENVILIPKYDCMAALPKTIGNARVVLGYSVVSSYGQTPLHAESFLDWPTWLLGGSWKNQRLLLDRLGDAVVGLDNNMVSKIARFGTYWNEFGESCDLRETMRREQGQGFPYVAMGLSLYLMRRALDRDYAGVEDVFTIEDYEAMSDILGPVGGG